MSDDTQRVHFAHASVRHAAAANAKAVDRLERAVRARSVSPAPMAARRVRVDAETLDERDDTPTVPTRVQR